MELLHVIDKPLKGWGKTFSSSDSGPIEVPDPQYYSKSDGISLFRLSKWGHIAPGEFFAKITDATPKVTGLPINGVVDSAGEAYCCLDNDRVINFGVGDDTVDTSHDISDGHATIICTDILSYKDATDEYVIISYNDATDANVARRVKSSTTWTDAWLSGLATQTNGTTLTKGVPHPMILGGDGDIYIGNGSYLASHTPGSTAVNYQRLFLGFGFTVTGLTLDGNFLVITGYLSTTFITSLSKSISKVFYWNYFSPGVGKPYDLNDNYVSGVFNRAGNVRAITYGKDATLKIQAQSGGSFAPIFQSGQIGSPPVPDSPKYRTSHGSIEDFQGMTHFALSGTARLMCISDEGYFHLRTQVATADGSASDIGMVKNLSSNSLYLGVKIGALYYIVKMDTAKYVTSGNWRSGLINLGYKGDVEMVKVLLSQGGSGASMILSIFQDYDTVSVGGATDLLNKTLAYNSTDGNIREFAIVKTIKDISSFYFNINFNHSTVTDTAFIVRRVEFWGSRPDKR